MRTHLLYLLSASTELKQKIGNDGPIRCLVDPPVYLLRPHLPVDGRATQLLSLENVQALNQFLALSCEYDPAAIALTPVEVDHHLKVVATGFQLVKPTDSFCEHWVQIHPDGRIGFSIPTQSVAVRTPTYHLAYQQYHTILPDDVERAIKFLPQVSRAQELGHSSWTHPCGPIHRAVVFFSQGYSVDLEVLPQPLWAAGLDCLFASKRDRHKRGAMTISQRLQTLWGAGFRPYKADTVTIPIHQTNQRPDHCLKDIAGDIFRLRNAFMHGLPIQGQWLSTGSPESGYAYQLLECTEILLRLTLLRLFEDSTLFDVFLDPVKLDNYF